MRLELHVLPAYYSSTCPLSRRLVYLDMQASTYDTKTLLQHADLVRTLAAADQYAKRAQLLLDLEAPKSPLTAVKFDILLTTAA